MDHYGNKPKYLLCYPCCILLETYVQVTYCFVVSKYGLCALHMSHITPEHVCIEHLNKLNKSKMIVTLNLLRSEGATFKVTIILFLGAMNNIFYISKSTCSESHRGDGGGWKCGDPE